MPRDAAGNMSLVAGNPVADGTTIETSWANPTMSDLANEIQNSLDRNGRGGMLVPFKNLDGTKATPAVTFTSEPASGLYRAGVNDVRMSIAGEDTARWLNATADPIGEQTPYQIWDGGKWVNPVTADKLPNYNFLINPEFNINQRDVTGTVALAANEYGHDRMRAGAGGCTYTFAFADGITTITILSGSLGQVVEANQVGIGSIVLSWAGTAQGQLDGGGLSPSPIQSVGTGGSPHGVEWGVGTLLMPKLERSAFATPFVSRLIQEEMALCRRYYEVGGGGANLFSGDVTNSATYYKSTRFEVPKRIVPTVTLINSGAPLGFPSVAGSVAGVDVNEFAESRVSNLTTAGGAFASTWEANAEIV